MSLDQFNCGVIDYFLYAWESPRSRGPWVLVQEMSSVSQLFPIKGATEFNMDFCLSHFFIELGFPLGFVPVNCDIQLLQHAEICARR